MKDYLRIGLIVNTHGIRGEVKVLPLTSDINRFDSLKEVWLEKNNDYTSYKVENIKYHKQFVLIKFFGIDNMNKAQELKDFYLAVDRKNARKLQDDEFFICDLIGSKVYEEEKYLGVLTDIIQTGSNDVYIVKNEEGIEIYIPALKSVVEKIDIKNKGVYVKLPEGLVD